MKNDAALQKEVLKLREQLAVEQEKNKAAITQLKTEQEKLSERDAQIAVLNERLKHLLKQRFAPSSEKTSPDQMGLFNEAEEAVADGVVEQTEPETTEVTSHTRTRKPRVTIPDALPREEFIYDIPETDKICPHDGAELTVVGSEDHEQLEIIPAKVKVIRHKRLKYACPCCDQHVVTASKPKQPIEKSLASPGLLAYITTQKYADALSLYRQSEMFKRIGINIGRANMANWMLKCGELVQPLINLLTEHLHKQPRLHLDETTLQVLDEPGKPAQSKSYMWVMTHIGKQPACVFHYADTLSQRVPLHLLSPDNSAIMTDGYEDYERACVEYKITRLGCLAHARRKFKDAQALQKKGKAGKADQALAYIQKLYLIEKKMKDEPPDKRLEVRQRDAKPILDKLKAWLDKSLLTVAPKTKIGEALIYLNNQWGRLIRYLEDGRYPIDNNAAERAIRPFAIGRKNWMFSKSQAGAKASANLYTLIETAKANDLNSYEYLQHIFKELPNAQSVEQIERLLPWNANLG